MLKATKNSNSDWFCAVKISFINHPRQDISKSILVHYTLIRASLFYQQENRHTTQIMPKNNPTYPVIKVLTGLKIKMFENISCSISLINMTSNKFNQNGMTIFNSN